MESDRGTAKNIFAGTKNFSKALGFDRLEKITICCYIIKKKLKMLT